MVKQLRRSSGKKSKKTIKLVGAAQIIKSVQQLEIPVKITMPTRQYIIENANEPIESTNWPMSIEPGSDGLITQCNQQISMLN